MRLLTDGEIPLHKWEEFMQQNMHATPFQSPGFYDLFNSTEGFSAEAFAVEEDSKIRSLVVVTFQRGSGIKGYFSRRAIIYGGPLLDEQSPETAGMLINAIVKSTEKTAIYTEVRNLSDYTNYKELFTGSKFDYVPYLNFRIDTGNRDEMIDRISSSRLRQIKKARKMSVCCCEASGIEEVHQFYNILRELYDSKLHKPLPGEDFFIEFHRRNLGKYMLVKHDNKVIGGMMCPLLEGRAVYEFYICGLDESFPDLYPSVMATWSVMEYASANGLGFFDMMGAGKPGEYYGVRDFKARFGGNLVEFGRFIRINKPLLYRTGKAGLSFLKGMGL